jgi:hypothetical protein
VSALLTSVEGIYRDGTIDLLEKPANVHEARVIVTFLPAGAPKEPTAPTHVDLQARGIGESQAAQLRGRLSAFAEDWEREDMDVYDAV